MASTCQFPVDNVLYLTDSYKVTHYEQYPPDTRYIYSYFECRPGAKYDEVPFFGLQYLIKRWLVGSVVTREMIEEARGFYEQHFMGRDLFNTQGWMYIVEKHGGRLPLRIKAVPEGTVVPVHNVLFTVENTDPAVPWLTNWFETLLVQAWYPITVCTISREQKKTIASYLHSTADNADSLPFKLHDFGYRGVSSVESAAIGDAAHLVNFSGTDTIAGCTLLRRYYNCDMPGHSIPASEHSTITSWGAGSINELAACRNMLEKFPDGLVAVVSDSYDVYECCRSIWSEALHDLVVERGDRNGTLVIRPDSGDPKTVILRVLQILEESFPVTINTKGYKQLPAYLRLIQGDGITPESLKVILAHLEQNGWSTENVAFGSGGSLLQRLNRDTQRCAFKCSNIVVGEQSRVVYKNPSTDPSKRSRKGRLTLERDSTTGEYATVEEGAGDPSKDILVTVFENGKLLLDWTLDEVRQRAALSEEHIRRAAAGLEMNGTSQHD